MSPRKATIWLVMLLLIMAGSCCLSLWFVLHDLYIPSFALGATAVGVAIAILRFNRMADRKLAFMFNSLENGDYSFRFTDDQRDSQREYFVNRALNRIKELLTRARDETIEQEKYYQLIMESTTTGIIVINPRGNICQTNREALRLIGFDPLTHITQLQRIDPQLPGLLRTIPAGESRQITYTNERGSQTLSFHAAEIVRKGEKLKILAMTDIENELNDREIESWIRLIRVLTHEIMNSIGPITSISDSLASNIGSENPQVKQGLETISHTAKNLSSFVDSYRKFTRIPKPEPSLFYMGEFLDNLRALAMGMPGVCESGANIVVSVEPDDLILYADRGLVSQVALNLLKNAVEATMTQPQSEIRIMATIDAQERVIITVADNGPGVSPEVIDHIFIPFFTTKNGGSGIGLSLSRQIMNLHGGTLKYRRGRYGNGSEFILTFR